MGELYEYIFWLNMLRNGGSFSSGMVAQPITERWLNLSGLGAQKGPEYSLLRYFAAEEPLILTIAEIVEVVLILLSSISSFSE